MKGEKISINEKENWGGLYHPEFHDAAIGVRIADNRRRDFGIFNDRITIVGDKKVAEILREWLFKSTTLKKIKRNTSFSFYGGDRDTNCWATMEKVKYLAVTLDVKCSGEYCYVSAYADVIRESPINIIPRVGDDGEKVWKILISGRPGDFPLIHADDKDSAMNMLLDYIANELNGKDDIR